MLHVPARLAALLVLSCGAHAAWGQAPAPKPKTPTTIDAEHIEGVSEFEVSARGRVEFQREDLTVYSEYLRFNQEFGRIEADGGVRLLRGVDRFFGPRLRYNTTDDTGVFEESTYVMRGEQSTMRGTAERLEFLGKSRYRVTRGSFTTCEPGKEDWRLEAREAELDRDNEVGTVRGGRFRFFDTTLLALPYASFSLDSQRKSGFLAPRYSQNSRRGLEVAVPYYWNIAPEQDLTLYPTYFSKRGAQLKTEYRHLGGLGSYGELRYEYMPSDRVLDRPRSGFTWQEMRQFSPQLWGRLDLNRVSDARYFVDLSSRVQQVSTGNLQQLAQLGYSGAFMPGWGYSLVGQIQRFQTLQDPLAPITPPYARLPQFNFSTTRTDIGGRFDFVLPAEFVRFSHPTLVEGTRVSLNPALAAPLIAPGYFLTPKAGARYAGYRLDQLAPGQADRPSVTVPWLSVDGGLIFDRNMRWFGESLTQTLEPRLFYVYAPTRNQDQIPIFDTGIPDLTFAQLFTENRFSGGDRFGDANQVTVAATSRILSPAGVEMLRGTIGQRYYFSDEHVGLTPTSLLRTRGQSDILASIGGRPARALTFDATMQYNQQENRAQRYGISARYAPEIAKVISASYRFNRDTLLRQVDIAGQWPVRPGWYAIGRFNYSLQDRRMLEGIAGAEYNAGCWVFRAAFQRLQAATQTVSSGIFFQMEFNGMGSLGSDEILTMLKRSVPGYAVTNPQDAQLVPPSMRPRLPFEQVF